MRSSATIRSIVWRFSAVAVVRFFAICCVIFLISCNAFTTGKAYELIYVSNYSDSVFFFDNKKLGAGGGRVEVQRDGDRHFIRVAKYGCADTVVEIRFTQVAEPVHDTFILPVLFGGGGKAFIKAQYFSNPTAQQSGKYPGAGGFGVSGGNRVSVMGGIANTTGGGLNENMREMYVIDPDC